MWAAVLLLFATYGYENTWKLWHVPTRSPSFLDFRLIPGTAESVRHGFDPTVENPGDPSGRVFNYPAAWYLLFHTGISQSDTIWLSVAMLALFFSAACIFPGSLNVSDVALMISVLFSPAAMLLYERGNVDALAFVFCALGVAALDRSLGVAALSFLVGAMLKVFPIFGLAGLVRLQTRSSVRWVAAAGGPFIVYLAMTGKNVAAAWSHTERGRDISYGANVIFAGGRGFFERSLAHMLPLSAVRPTLSIAPYALATALVVIVTVAGMASQVRMPVRCQRNLDAFRVGAAIYVGTFLLGNNWDYRLVFLVLTVPQLSQWVHDAARGCKLLCASVVILMLWSCWYLMIGYGRSRLWFVLDECANWSLMASLAYLFAASAPEWFRPAWRPVALTFHASDAEPLDV